MLRKLGENLKKKKKKDCLPNKKHHYSHLKMDQPETQTQNEQIVRLIIFLKANERK